MWSGNPYAQDQLKLLERRLEVSTRRAALRTLKRIAWRLTISVGHVAKRMLDIIVSLVVLAILAPLLLLVAIMIKLTDRGPILFWQIRVGKWGQTFRFPKFRSMVVNAEALQSKLVSANEHGNGVTFKLKRDPRTTHIGRIIRKTSIDELPQLWCVLKGEMSLVGPRPALVNEVARYSLDDRIRLNAIPGLTCIWQVSGRSKIPFPEQVVLDAQYIEQQSLWTDLKLLVLTIPAVITGRGAY